MADTTWDTELNTPIAHAALGLNDLVPDSILVKNSDNSLRLVYNYQVALDSIDQYLDVPDTLQEKSVTISKLVLDNRTLSDTITLGEIYPLAKILNGQTLDLQGFDEKSNTGTDIDITKEFFKQAKFRQGFIDMTLSNDLPVEAEKIVFLLVNKSDQEIIIYDSFTNVLPNTSVTTSKSIAGKKIDGVLTGIVKRVKTKPSGKPVLIESEKGIRLDLSIRDLELEYATAIFPAQNLVEEKQEIRYNLGSSEITFLAVKTGFLLMEVYSNVNEAITLSYTIPNSSRNNNFNDNVKQVVKVPPAAPGSFSKVIKKFPLDNYEIYLKGQFPNQPPFKPNTIYSEFTASIDYTGVERTLSLSDSVYVRFGLIDIKPYLAIGDFGKRQFSFEEKNPVKFFKNLEGGINLEDVEMNLWFENSFGIEADMTVNHIVGVNNRANRSVQLISTGLDNTFTLKRAVNNPFLSSIHNINFNKSNSNLKQFLENIPDELDSKFNIVVRPRGSQDYTDFVFDYSKLTANLNLEMPVQFGTSGLQLSNVQAFDFAKIKNSDRIKSGVLKLDVLNGFPLEASCNLEFLDENDQLLTTLFEKGKEQSILPANLDSKGKVNAPVYTKVIAEINEEQTARIKRATRIRVIASFKTPNSDRYKIYDDYKFDVKLKGNFIYEQGF